MICHGSIDHLEPAGRRRGQGGLATQRWKKKIHSACRMSFPDPRCRGGTQLKYLVTRNFTDFLVRNDMVSGDQKGQAGTLQF